MAQKISNKTLILIVAIALLLVVGGFYFSGYLNLTGNSLGGNQIVNSVEVCRCTTYVLGQPVGYYDRPSPSGKCTGAGEAIIGLFTPGVSTTCQWTPVSMRN